jgi:hypothetical protein
LARSDAFANALLGDLCLELGDGREDLEHKALSRVFVNRPDL